MSWSSTKKRGKSGSFRGYITCKGNQWKHRPNEQKVSIVPEPSVWQGIIIGKLRGPGQTEALQWFNESGLGHTR
eukprot:scaffold173056_cov12-Tisochrysis_lutea.AAC.1